MKKHIEVIGLQFVGVGISDCVLFLEVLMKTQQKFDCFQFRMFLSERKQFLNSKEEQSVFGANWILSNLPVIYRMLVKDFKNLTAKKRNLGTDLKPLKRTWCTKIFLFIVKRAANAFVPPTQTLEI